MLIISMLWDPSHVPIKVNSTKWNACKIFTSKVTELKNLHISFSGSATFPHLENLFVEHLVMISSWQTNLKDQPGPKGLQVMELLE